MPPPLRPTRLSPTTVVIPRGGTVLVPHRPPPPVTPGPTPPPPAGGDLEARALALIAEVHAIKHEMAANAYRLGVALRELSQPEMIRALRCAGFDEVLARHGLPVRMTALKYIALAEHFGEAEAAAIGPEKAYALVRYARALPRPEAPKQLLARSAKVAGVLIRDAAVADILRAARDLAEKQREGAAAEDDSAAEADRAVRRLGAKLRRSGAAGAKLKRVRRGSSWRVTIELDPDEAIELAAHL